MRDAIKNVLYTVVNSNAMNGIAPGSKISYSLAPWEKGCVAAIAVTGVLFAGVVVMSILRARDEKKNPQNYQTKKNAN